MQSSEKLQRSVVNELAWDESVDASKISVTASGDGVITLEGEVPTYRQKKAAENDAKRIVGVHAVANDLAVSLVMEKERDDTALAEAAVQALEWNASVPHEKIKVTVEDGWVTLEGLLRQEFQRSAAYEAVRDLIGVRGLDNEIKLEHAVEPKDVRENIRSAFERRAVLDAKAVDVEVDGHTVILRGEVSSWRERDEAEEAAWSAEGISEVENQLEVKHRAVSE